MKATLTPRIRQLLQLLADDHSLEEAAAAMGIGRSTADKYSAKIRCALGCRTLYGALVQAVRRQFVAAPSSKRRKESPQD